MSPAVCLRIAQRNGRTRTIRGFSQEHRAWLAYLRWLRPELRGFACGWRAPCRPWFKEDK